MGSQEYTIYKEYIDSDLTWFPVTIPLTTTQAPTGFWEGLESKKLVSDGFTGANGSAPDSERWSNAGTSIQGNKLRLNSTGNVQVDSVFTLQGDFEIEHDFTLNLHPSTERWYYQMRATDVTSGSNDLFSVMRQYRSSDNYICYKSNGGTEDPVNGVTISRDDLTGRLRLRRVGTTMYGDYYHPTNGWTNITSESMTGLTGDVRIGLWLRRHTSNPVAEMDIDYFKVTYADGIDWDADDTGLDVDDDFTGVNGNLPNETKWLTTHRNPTLELQSNKLYMVATGNPGITQCRTNYTISGDFDVRVDFDITGYPSVNFWRWQLQAEISSIPATYVMSRRYENTDGYTYHSTAGGWQHDVGSNDSTGKFRLTRVGDKFSGYYWNNGWVQMGTEETHSTEPVRFKLYPLIYNDITISGYWDNFTVIHADEIIWDNLADRVYFEDSDGDKLYAEIETFDPATSAATYHVATPTVSSTADTAITVNWDWEGRDYSIRELPETDWSDDFTGANGSSPDTVKWRNIGSGCTIQNNKLNITLAPGEGNSNSNMYWRFEDNGGPEFISGNIDVQVDFEVTGTGSFWGAQLIVEDLDGEGCSHVRGWYGRQQYWTWVNGVGWQADIAAASSGKLRVTRVGNTWTTYRNEGAGWLVNHTWTTATAGKIDRIDLYLRHGDGEPACSVNFDNFTVNGKVYKYSETDDDFTGNDGDPPDVMKWDITQGTPEIQSNELRLHNSESLGFKPLINGDFDVQVDWADVVAPSTNSYWWALRVFYDSDNYLDMAKGYWSGAEGFANEGYNDGGYFLDSAGTTDSSGKFRITRSGSTWNAYRWAGNAWTQTGLSEATQTGMPTGPVKISFYTSLWDTAPTIDVDFDNFQINSADSITGWTENTGEWASQQVWDSNFKIVTHLADTPTGSADDILDSTGNENHGTSYNMAAGNSGSNSFGKYITFDGSNEFIDFGDAFFSNEVTMESVTNVTSFTGGQPRMIWLKRNLVGTSTTDSANSEWACQYIDADTLNFQAWTQPGSDIVASDGRDSPTDLTGTELYYAGAFPAAASGSCYSYLNGEHGLGTLRKTDDLADGPLGIQLGTRSNNNNSRWFLGNMREARLSNIQRSHAWIKATNLSLMGGLFDEPTIAGSSGSEVYTIDKDRIDEELTWFPTTLSLDFTGSPAPSADFWDYFNNIGLNPNDDFTGIDGQEPDTNKWTVALANPTCEILDNKLREVATGSTVSSRATCVFQLVGNFDIQVDYDLTTHPNTEFWRWSIQMVTDSAYWNLARRYEQTFNRYSFWGNSFGPYNVSTSDTSGKLRLRRSGSTLMAFYWNGSDWAQVGSNETVDTGDIVSLNLDNTVWNGVSVTGDWDNFIINHADDIKWNYGDRLYFEDSDSNRLYAEIEQFDTTSDDFTYHFAVPTISAGEDTPITLNWDWEDREYSTKNLTRTWTSDDFTGNDGSLPDTTKWEITLGTPTIQSNALQFNTSGGTELVFSKFFVGGDFDVQIDFDLSTLPDTNSWTLSLRAYGDDDNHFSTRIEYDTARNYKKFGEDGGGVVGAVTASTSDTSGKLRIIRVGNDFGGYYWNGSAWVQIGTDTTISGLGGKGVSFLLSAETWNTSPTMIGTLDNFQINGAGSIYLTDEANDTFTGTNGDPPDVLKWREAYTSSVAPMTIQNNKLHFDGGGGPTTVQSQKISRFRILGDFDVQIDWDITTWDSGGTADNYAGYFSLSDDTQYVYITRQQLIPGHDRIRLYGSGGTNDFGWSWTGLSGKMRFVQTSGTLVAYVWTGSQWEYNGNTNGYTCSESFSDATINLYCEQEVNGEVVANFDNFQINSADSITGWTDNTGNQPAKQVWDNNFQIVTHLHQEPTGNANDILDSTGYENHGTSYNMDSTNSSNNEFGKYLTFDGTEEFIDFGDAFYSDILTLETVINPTVVNDYDTFLHKRNTVGAVTKVDPPEWEFSIQPTGDIRAVIWQDNSNFVQVDSSTSDLVAGIESYVAGAFPGNGSGNAVTQVDDSENGSATHNKTVGDRASGIQVASRTNEISTRYYNGDIREIRISNAFRSTAWRSATHYSLNGQIWVPLDVEAPSSWDLVIQDMTVATSTEQVEFIVNLIIQNLNVLTSAEATKLIPLLNINDLDINTTVGRMKFWDALSTINTSVEFRTLLRTILSKTPKHTLEFKTLKRTLKQYDG